MELWIEYLFIPKKNTITPPFYKDVYFKNTISFSDITFKILQSILLCVYKVLQKFYMYINYVGYIIYEEKHTLFFVV